MDEPIIVSEQGADELKEWETPELIVEDVRSVTRGGGAAPLIERVEGGGGIDPEFYRS